MFYPFKVAEILNKKFLAGAPLAPFSIRPWHRIVALGHGKLEVLNAGA